MRRKLGAGRKVTKEPVSLKAAKLGARIKKTRKAQGYRLTDIEKRLGITHQALSNIENGITNPDDARARRTIQKLAELFDDDFGLPWVGLSRTRTHEIPIAARVAGGRPIERIVVNETVVVASEFGRMAGALVAVIVEGNSMIKDHIIDNDLLVCRLIEDPKEIGKDALVIVRLREEFGEGAIKRWRLQGEGKEAIFILSSDHNDPDAEKMPFPIWKFAEAFEPLGLIRRLT